MQATLHLCLHKKMGKESIDFVVDPNILTTIRLLSSPRQRFPSNTVTSLKVQVEYVRGPTFQSHADSMCKTVTCWCKLYNGQSCAV